MVDVGEREKLEWLQGYLGVAIESLRNRDWAAAQEALRGF